MSKFTISRADGRSDAQVVIDLVKDGTPGCVYTYEDLGAALSADAGHSYGTADVQGVVTRALPRLLKEHCRALHNVRKVGYRLAPAAFHVTLANDRQAKADKQMLRGMQTLKHVRWDEMDENQKLAHQGQLLITQALYSQMQALERRQSAIERTIAAARTKAG